MKKLFLLTLALVMTLALSACSGGTNTSSQSDSNTVTMVEVTTEQGISLKLPSDMTIQDNLAYANTETADVATFGVIDAGASPLSEYTQEEFLAAELSHYKDIAIKSFENNIQINGKAALVCKYTFTTEGGAALAGALIMVADGSNEYVVSFLHESKNTDGSLAKNLQTCIDSIVIVAK